MKKRKINNKKITLFIFIIIFLSMFILSSIKIINYLKDNKQNRDIKKIVSEAVTIEPTDTLEERYKVNFKVLKEKNSDTVAYLKVNNTNIDYIVTKAKDNKYYLNHNFNKESNVSGWVFADYHNKFDNTDKNIIIYAHNTMDGSMFGTLKNVLTDEWYKNKDNHQILLITENKVNIYEVFSTYVIESENYYITTDFVDDSEFETFINNLKFRSTNSYNVDLNKTDRILTLSTCTADGKKRVVLHAKLIKED